MSERFCPRDGSALRSQNKQNDLVGTVIAERYHVIKKLGEGGMGAVYLAEHVKMGRKSAIKVMNPGMHQDADAIARFNREASNASRLNHPNICAIYDFGETSEGLIYLAMEYIEGKSLTALIEERGALAAGRAASIVHQAADALQVAHDYGIVHRDLKPDNIMITKDRNGVDIAKVVDFGIAKASSSDAQKVTKTGLVVGTPEYMSPEQLAGDKLDGRSDIYSLALVAFNCFTGTLPFPSNSAQEAMIMRLTDHPKTLAEMKSDVAWPPELQQVMDRALARDAKDRTASAAEFGRALSKAVEGMPSQAASAEMGTMVMGAQAAPAPGAIPATRVADRAERTPSRASAATLQQGAVSVPSSAATPQAPPSEIPPKKGSTGLVVGGVGGLIAVAAAVYFAMFAGKSTPETKPNLGGGAQTSQATGAPSDGATGTPSGGTPTGGTPTGGSKSPTGIPGGSSQTTKTQPPVPGTTTTPGGTAAPVNAAKELARLEKLAEQDGNPDAAAEAEQGINALMGSLKAADDKLFAQYILGLSMYNSSGKVTEKVKQGCALIKRIAPAAKGKPFGETVEGLLANGSCKDL